MVLQLKKNLLIDILNPNNITNKYYKSLLNIKTIFEIEKEEGFKIPEFINNMFNEIKDKEHNFINDIPLQIVEYYFLKKVQSPNSYVYILYQEKEINIKTNELFLLLENFYSKIFLIASLIANYYNLEIKINNNSKDDNFI